MFAAVPCEVALGFDMACYSPLSGWRARRPEASGKYRIVFSPSQGFLDMPMTVPCGQCVGCRLERSRQWAVRCVHEASLHADNCFITLTYNNDNLPADGSLDVTHFQKFMKRLRKKYGEGIRFFHCGEYGASLGRPHYHAAIFGFDFPDKVLWKKTPHGNSLYRSASLESLWPFGYSSIGALTFDSAAYVARYIMKKVTGDKSVDHYGGLKPEYTTMSRRPGIASGWFDKYSGDVFPSDEVVFKGRVFKPPRYYDGLFEVLDPEVYSEIKSRRKRAAAARASDSSRDRLAVREKVKKAQIKSLTRGYEDVNS